MRRRPVASPVIAAVLAVVLAPGAVFAVDPYEHGGLEHRESAGGARADRATREAASDVVIQSHPGANGKIAYSRSPAGFWPAQIWVQDLDGSDLAKLTFGTLGKGDNSPAWSPGGTLIAFTRDQTSSTTDDSDDVYIMNADGSGLKRLTNTSAGEFAPTFSRDGGLIAFSSNRDGNFEIYTMRIDGSDVRRLTNDAANDWHPNWSPDAPFIAFTSDRAGNFEIYTMHSSGSGVTRRTTRANDDFSPNWSPDGTKIAFTSVVSGYDDVFVMNADGSSVADLTNSPGTHEGSPSWSPDGSWIIYGGNQYGDSDILAMTADGSFLGGIASTSDDEFNPDWQPIPAFPLVDARFSTFEVDIHWVFDQAITTGCSAERYCSDDPVTREQMASFLVRALDLPAATQDWFTDDEASIHESNINRIAEAGIASGCGGTDYCPKAVVTREQMASFLARAFDLPSSPTDFFTDDETSIHEPNINSIAAAGIATGCAVPQISYCPTAVVTREQMAAFLHRALD